MYETGGTSSGQYLAAAGSSEMPSSPVGSAISDRAAPPPSQRPRRGNAEAAGRRIGIVVVIGPALAAGRPRAAVTRAGRRLQLVMTVGPFYGRSALGVGRDTLWGSCPCTSCLLGVSSD